MEYIGHSTIGYTCIHKHVYIWNLEQNLILIECIFGESKVPHACALRHIPYFTCSESENMSARFKGNPIFWIFWLIQMYFQGAIPGTDMYAFHWVLVCYFGDSAKNRLFVTSWMLTVTVIPTILVIIFTTNHWIVSFLSTYYYIVNVVKRTTD